MNIEIDFDVFKALTGLRESERDSYNTVIRRLLKLPDEPTIPDSASAQNGKMWKFGGGSLPVGTILRGKYKGVGYQAELTEHSIRLNGVDYDTPSKAAMAISKSSVNGWIFWEFQNPNVGGWSPLAACRPVQPTKGVNLSGLL